MKKNQSRQSIWFSKVGTRNFFSRTRHSRGASLMIWGIFSNSAKLKLLFVRGRQIAADHVTMLNYLSLEQEGRPLCGEEQIFKQINEAIHNATLTKKYLLEQKTRLLDYTGCTPDLNTKGHLWGLIVAKVYDGGRQYSAIFKLKNLIFF